MDPWDLIVTGHYEQAIHEYSARAGQDDALALRNRATAFLLLERYDEAFHDIQMAESHSPIRRKEGYFHSDGDQLRLGVIEWLSRRFQAAGDRWLRIGNALHQGHVTYSDASGGIGTASILRFAAVRLHRQDIRRRADRLLKKLVKRPTYQSWPLPIGNFYLGNIDKETLLASTSDKPVLRERELCQAHFAVAVTNLESSQESGYRDNMSVAASYSGAVIEDEYFLARFEARMGNKC